MQDNSEQPIHEREEGSDELIHEREEWDEEREWEPKFEEIKGIDNEQDDVTARGSTFVCSRGPPKPKRHKSPCEQVMLNLTSVGRCC